MRIWISSLAYFVIALTQWRAELVAEQTALRQQLTLMGRRRSHPVPLARTDRIFFALLYRFFPGLLGSIHIVRPDTLIRWHRIGFRALWRRKSGPRGERPKISKEIREPTREISLAAPL